MDLFNCGLRIADWGVKTNPNQSTIPNSELRILNWDIPHSAFRIPNSGMTFIEVILVMAILGILAAMVIPKLDLPVVSSKASVDGAAYLVASDIRYAQESAMATRVSRSVIFTSGSSSYTFNPASSLDPSGQLPSGVTISNNYTVTFNSLGEPTAGGDGSVTISAGGQTRAISVLNYTGKVNIS
jgi:prepilin-type N-terminal cleavage/methylation domain-containing protein